MTCQANGKVGEQITEVASDVMVKLAAKIGMTPEEQVECSVEAAKVGKPPEPPWECLDTRYIYIYISRQWLDAGLIYIYITIYDKLL